jgi:hypothetical protein
MAERIDARQRPIEQRVWDAYCFEHSKKYGTPFEPDVNPQWDR